jgi:hypothetical protein
VSEVVVPRLRIRLPFDLSGRSQTLDAITSGAPIGWRGNDIQFEVGLFWGEDLDTLVDLANIESLTLEIRDRPTRVGTIYASVTVEAGDLDGTLTVETWEDGTKQHALFALTHEETNWSQGAALEGVYFLVLSCITTDDPLRQFTLGYSLFKLWEDGVGEGAPVTEPPVVYLSGDECDARFLRRRMPFGSFRASGDGKHLQLYNPTTGKWHTLGCDGPEGAVAPVFDQVGEAE